MMIFCSYYAGISDRLGMIAQNTTVQTPDFWDMGFKLSSSYDILILCKILKFSIAIVGHLACP